MKKEVEELVLAIDEVVVGMNPTLADVAAALNQLSTKYERDAYRVMGGMPYKDIRAERMKRLKVPYSVLSQFD